MALDSMIGRLESRIQQLHLVTNPDREKYTFIKELCSFKELWIIF